MLSWLLGRSHGRHLPRSNHEHLRTSTTFEDIGEAGPLITGLFEKVADIPGWFTVDDCMHFHLVLAMQAVMGVAGDLFEIGSYHGRSTAVMARHLKPSERIVVCDAFEAASEDHYDQRPSPEILVDNVTRANPGLDRSQIVIHSCMSTELSLPVEQQFRFIHVDGGHSSAVAHADVMLSSRHLIPKGVMVIDDYHNPLFPQVTEGVDRFLSESTVFDVLGDLNRHGALGRKLYLIRR